MLSLALSALLSFVAIGHASAAFGTQSKRVFVSTPVSTFPKRIVRECMSPAYPVLTRDMSVDDAMVMFFNNNLQGAPVVNEDNVVEGIVTTFDFLEKEAFEGALLPMEGSKAMVQHYVDAAKKICGQRVEDVMSRHPSVVSPTCSMREAAALMAEKKLHRLPVVDPENGKLVGILTSGDVMKDLLHIVWNLPEGKADAEASSEPVAEMNMS